MNEHREKLPQVSIVIVNHNGLKFLKECFESLYATDYPRNKLEVIMVDNCSQDKSVEFVKENYPWVKVILNEDNNYCRANNLGIKASKGKYVVLLNNDTKVDKNWLIELVKVMESDEKIGAVGSKILFMDGKIQSVGHQEYPNFYWGDRGFKEEDKGQYDFLQEVPSLCGACTMYRRKCLDDVGLLDEDFIMFVEDVDMAIRCRKKGWKLVIVPSSIVYHHYHGTSLSEEIARYYIERNRLFLIAKHYPKKLPQALAGREYFIRGGQRLEREFMEIFGNVLIKLIKEQGMEVTSEIIPELIFQLHQIFNLSKDHVVQELAKERREKEVLHKEIETKGNHIRDLQSKLAEYERELRKTQLDLEQMSRVNEEIVKVEKEREERIEELARLNEKFRKMIDELIRKEEKREREIQELIRKRDEYLLKLSELDEVIKCKDEEISKLSYLKEELTSLIKEKDESIQSLYNELQSKEEEIKGLSRIKEELMALITEKDANIQSLYNELQSIYNSTGFRYLLKPLWTVLWPLKQFFKKNWRLTFNLFILLTHPARSKRKIDSFRVWFSVKRKTKNNWVKKYFDHIFKGYLPPSPKYLTLMVTSKCNLRCVFCNIPDRTYKRFEIPVLEAFKIIDSASILGVERIDFTGGEPLLYPDLWKIEKYAAEKGIKTSLVTNGVLISNHIEEFRKSSLDSVCVSLDGEKHIHEMLRGASGIYEKIIDGINLLKKQNIEIFINFVITNKNIYDLEKIINMFNEQNIKVNFWPVNEKGELFLETKKEITDFDNLMKKFEKTGLITSSYYKYLKYVKNYFKNNKNIRVRCLGFGYNLAIDVEGNILPCCVWEKKELKVGNVQEDDLTILWYSEKAWQMRRKILFEGCKNCWNTALAEFSELTGLNFINK